MPHVVTWGYLHAGSTWVKAGSLDVTRRFGTTNRLPLRGSDLFLHHFHIVQLPASLMERQRQQLIGARLWNEG